MDVRPLNLRVEDKVHGISLVALLILVLVAVGLFAGLAMDHLSEVYAASVMEGSSARSLPGLP